MVIVGGAFQVDPGERDAFVAERAEVMRRSRAEEGCIEYVMAADPLEPGRVVLFERWASQADLDAHLAGMSSGSDSDRPSIGSSSRSAWSSTSTNAATAAIGLVIDAMRNTLSRSTGAGSPRVSVPAAPA